MKSIMNYELAIMIQKNEVIKEIKNKLKELSSSNIIYRGYEICSNFQNLISRKQFNSFINILKEAGILETKKVNNELLDYNFKIIDEKIDSYFTQQFNALEVLNELEKLRFNEIQDNMDLLITIPNSFKEKLNTNIEQIYPSLLKILNIATKEIWIINPFFDLYSINQLIDAIISNTKKGIKVNILTRVEKNNENIEHIKKIFNKIQIQGNQDNFEVRDFFEMNNLGKQIYALHSKIMIADDIRCYLGSANITEHGLRNNFEFGVLIKNQYQIKIILDIIRVIWDNSKIVFLNNGL